MFYINPDYNSDEKYDLAKFFSFEVDNYDVLDSYFFDNIINLPVRGVFTVTVEEQRPDLISNSIYETVNYWSLLLIYNNILSVEDIVTGTKINYFDIKDLENLFYNLKSLGS